MRKSFLTVCIILIVITVLFCGCSPTKPDKEESTLTLSIGCIASEGFADYQAIEVFKEVIEEETQGKVKVEIFPDSQLGTYKEMLEQIKAGTLIGLFESVGVIGPWHPLAGLEAVPYLYKSEEHFFKVWHGELGQEIMDVIAQESGFRIVGPAYRGFRQMTTNRPINKVEDLEGLKMRSPAIPAYVDALTALGANPTPLAFEEVFTALQQGLIEGQENPVSVIHDNHLHEVQDYLIMTNHMAETLGFIFNEEWYKGLDEDIREAIQNAAMASSDWYLKHHHEEEANRIKDLEAKGMKVIYPDLDGFMERGKRAKIDPSIEHWVERIRNVD